MEVRQRRILERRSPRRSAEALGSHAAPGKLFRSPPVAHDARHLGQQSPRGVRVAWDTSGSFSSSSMVLRRSSNSSDWILPSPQRDWRRPGLGAFTDTRFAGSVPGSSGRELTSSIVRRQSRSRGCLGHRSPWPAMRRIDSRATVLVARPSMPSVKFRGGDAGLRDPALRSSRTAHGVRPLFPSSRPKRDGS